MFKKKMPMILAALVTATVLSACGNANPVNTSSDASQSVEQSSATSSSVSESAPSMDVEPTDETQSTRVQIEESQWKEYYHKMFTKNQPNEIFSRHNSISHSIETAYDPWDYDTTYYYITKDSAYYYGDGFAEYSKDHVIYMISGTGDEWQPAMIYYLDFTEDYKPYMYWFSEDENEWVNAEYESITDMYVEDGKIHMHTDSTEEGSKLYFDIFMTGYAYGGEKVTTEVVADEQTYELEEMRVYYETQGNTELVKTQYITYDEPEPSTKRALIGAFERTAEKMMTVTVTVKPNTDKELTKSITVPAYSDVACYTPDIENAEYYTDRECTKVLPEGWDMASDLTIFIQSAE